MLLQQTRERSLLDIVCQAMLGCIMLRDQAVRCGENLPRASCHSPLHLESSPHRETSTSAYFSLGIRLRRFIDRLTDGLDHDIKPLITSDSMEAAGLASSIITFIDFSHKLINGTVVIYKKSAIETAADPHISSVIDDLEDATKAMKATWAASAGQTTPHQRGLLRLADECNELSQELIAILKDLERKTNGSKLWRSLQASWGTLRKSDKIVNIEQKLNTYRLQILLRLSLMLNDQGASVEARLGQMHQGNIKYFKRTVSEHQIVQKSMKELDARLVLQAYQASHIPLMTTEHTDALIDIRGRLSRITQTLEAARRHAPAEMHVLDSLRFENVYSRFDAVVDGEFRTFMSHIGNTEAVPGHENAANVPESVDHAQRHARNALGRWLELGEQVLHISGKAGSGKSTLMKLLSQDKTLLKRLHTWAGNTKLVVAKFFFWNAGNALQNSLEGLYRSILLEVLQQCPELTRQAFPAQCNEILSHEGVAAPKTFPFRLVELQDAMEMLVQGLSDGSNYRFCFFIDGLDEYAGESMDHIRLAWQLRLWAKSPYIKICASSRPHEKFQHVFKDYSRIHIHELTGQDLLKYSRNHLHSVDQDYLTSDQVEDLAVGVRQRAKGVFLWANLVLVSLRRRILHGDTYGVLREKLNQTPADLMKLFLHLFQQISPADKTRAYQMLQILGNNDFNLHDGNAIMFFWLEDLRDPDFPYNAPRHVLSDGEVAWRIKYVERQLKSTCNGLLELSPVREKSGTDPYFRHSLRFHHRTVQDFLDQPETISAMEQHLGKKTIASSDILRLRLAQIKFTRTCLATLKPTTSDPNGYGTLQRQFLDVCQSARKHPRVLEECGKILQKYREEPYSLPDKPVWEDDYPWILSDACGKTSRNDGIAFLGRAYRAGDTRSSSLHGDSCADLSWIHYLAYDGPPSEFIMDRITSRGTGDSSPDMCLVLTASLGFNPDLLESLLNHGMQLRSCVGLRNRSPACALGDMQYVPGWVAFLVFLGNESCDSIQVGMCNKLYTSLESLLRRQGGSDLEVSMEFHRRRGLPRSEWCDKSEPTWEPVKMSLEDLILSVRPSNMDTLFRELHSRKTWRGWASSFASRTLGEASGWLPTVFDALSAGNMSSPLDGGSNVRQEYADICEYRVRRIWVGETMYEIGPDPGVRVY